jgi:hypothetical protein
MIDAATEDRIKVLLREFMDSWIAKQYEELRRIEEDGFSPSGVLAPFHDALVPGIRVLENMASPPRSGTSTNESRSPSVRTHMQRRGGHLT